MVLRRLGTGDGYCEPALGGTAAIDSDKKSNSKKDHRSQPLQGTCCVPVLTAGPSRAGNSSCSLHDPPTHLQRTSVPILQMGTLRHACIKQPGWQVVELVWGFQSSHPALVPPEGLALVSHRISAVA